ncbi:MAG TPA: DUF6134 family protein [Geminicoccaceae bacterium]|nr:DUF6134 family protein [Geminicoccaceae bacterium]
MMGRRWVAAAAAAVLAASASGAWADDAGVFTFTVSRDGKPIGEHRVAFRHQGDRIEIETDMELKVSFAMVPVFRFTHRSHEIWEEGKPVLINATTDDDGRKYDITVHPNGHGLVRTVNERVDKLDGATKVLALWNRDTVTSPPGNFVSIVEDKTLDVAFRYLGKESMTLDGRLLDVDHYQMVGEEERDIWYDADGRVARVTFMRDGSQIEYRRNEYHSAPFATDKMPQ